MFGKYVGRQQLEYLIKIHHFLEFDVSIWGVFESKNMALVIASLVLLLGPTFIASDETSWSLSGNGCSLSNADETELTCTDQRIGDKDLTLIINIKNCDIPPTIEVTVKALGFSWSHNFKSDERIVVPGLSVKVPGKLASVGIYVKIQMENTGSNLKIKMMLLSGFEAFGKFETVTSSTLATTNQPISVLECGIEYWWNSLSTFLKVLVVCGGLIVLGTLGTCCCCCCCCRCCRTKFNNRSVVVVPPAAATVTSTRTNVPMQPFVNEI